MKNLIGKLTILYARRSGNETENSIENQRIALEEYAASKGVENTLFLSDDGYSGVGFDRPGFQKLLELVKTGRAETVIVSDLSRMDRIISQVREYTDEIFQSCGVRFVSLDLVEDEEITV